MSRPLFEIKDVDREYYAACVRDFLPPAIIDIHTHVWLDEFVAKDSVQAARAVKWPALVARDNSIEDLTETYRLLFPDKRVTPLMFGYVLTRQDDIRRSNAYVSRAARKHGFPALVFASPQWSAAELEDRIVAGGFLGAKVYLTLSEPYLPEKEIRIFDFLPHHQLEVLNRRGWIVMLHIPRDGRLRDPVNLAQLLEIDRRYPRAKVLVAHMGRAYCPEDVGGAFDLLAATKHLRFEITANTNAEVFGRTIQAFGPKRILFGSDLPITRMRMRRLCENGNYVNVVPKGLYGDVTGDKHMREAVGAEAGRLSFFLYEEINAFRLAAEANKLTRRDVEDVFSRNAERMFKAIERN